MKIKEYIDKKINEEVNKRLNEKIKHIEKDPKYIYDWLNTATDNLKDAMINLETAEQNCNDPKYVHSIGSIIDKIAELKIQLDNIVQLYKIKR